MPRLHTRLISYNLSFALAPASTKTSNAKDEDKHRLDAELHPPLRLALVKTHLLRPHQQFPKQILEAPQPICHPRHHSRRRAALATTAALVREASTPDEIVIGQEQRAGRFQALQLLAEPKGQPGEPLHKRADREVVPLYVARAYRYFQVFARLANMTQDAERPAVTSAANRSCKLAFTVNGKGAGWNPNIFIGWTVKKKPPAAGLEGFSVALPCRDTTSSDATSGAGAPLGVAVVIRANAVLPSTQK